MKGLLVVFLILMLSACTTRHAPAPISEISGKRYYSEYTKGKLTGDKYKVKQGETLYAIAWRAGIDFRQLARANKISKPYQIFPGQIITLQTSGQTQVNQSSRNQTRKETIPHTKNQKKSIANKNSGEYGKTQQDQKHKKEVNKDPFPSKVRKWRYPNSGNIIAGYSSKENGNNGLDFGGKAGDPIYAAADGKVVYAGSALRGYGNLIIVKHNNDYLSAYAHNQSLLVKEQDWVKAGQRIATMGKSGTERVKLHFEIRHRGRSVNPAKYLPRR